MADYLQGNESGLGVYTPQNLNLYGYAHQQPITLKDPDGQNVAAYAFCTGPQAVPCAAGISILLLGAWMLMPEVDSGPSVVWTPPAEPLPPLPPSIPVETDLPNHTGGTVPEVDMNDGILADPILEDIGATILWTPISNDQGPQILAAVQPGHYVILGEQDGESRVYVGKGDEARMQASIRRIRDQGGTITDFNWEASDSHRDAFKDEADLIEYYGQGLGVRNPELWNRINSPGKRYNEIDGNSD